jgi:hypothetical protein
MKHGHGYVKDNKQNSARSKCEDVNNYGCRYKRDENVGFETSRFVADIAPKEGSRHAAEQGY